MCLADEGVDLMFMMNNVWLQVIEVENLRALSLWEDEVQEEDEAEP